MHLIRWHFLRSLTSPLWPPTLSCIPMFLYTIIHKPIPAIVTIYFSFLQSHILTKILALDNFEITLTSLPTLNPDSPAPFSRLAKNRKKSQTQDSTLPSTTPFSDSKNLAQTVPFKTYVTLPFTKRDSTTLQSLPPPCQEQQRSECTTTPSPSHSTASSDWKQKHVHPTLCDCTIQSLAA